MDIDITGGLKVIGCAALILGCGIGAFLVRFGPSLFTTFRQWINGF